MLRRRFPRRDPLVGDHGDRLNLTEIVHQDLQPPTSSTPIPTPRPIRRRFDVFSLLRTRFMILCSQFAPIVMTNMPGMARYRGADNGPCTCANPGGRYWD